MSQYIPIYMDNEENNYHNKGLYDIIEFIGKQSKRGKNLSGEEAYNQGKKIINSRLNKRHLTAIKCPVNAKKIENAFNYDQTTEKPLWKIHRRKAAKIFNAINWILKNYDSAEIIMLFNSICQTYGFISGDNAVGNPYYDIIKDRDLCKILNYSKIDDEDLKKCADAISSFSVYH